MGRPRRFVTHVRFVEDVMNKRILCSIGAAGMLSMAISGGASARSVAAHTGDARLGSQSNCFDASFTTGEVTSTCNADFLVPLTTDSAGGKNLTYTRKATAAGASCRAISNNRFGTAPQATAFDAVPVSASFVSFTFAAINVPAQGVFLADCITNPGTALQEFDYVP
jgi:hypothetical protein